MAKVWIPKSAGHSFAAAEVFGEIRIIFDDSSEIFNPQRLREVAAEKLREFERGDWLLLSGPALMNAIVFQLILAEDGHVKLLLFHSKTSKYLERVYNDES